MCQQELLHVWPGACGTMTSTGPRGGVSGEGGGLGHTFSSDTIALTMVSSVSHTGVSLPLKEPPTEEDRGVQSSLLGRPIYSCL